MNIAIITGGTSGEREVSINSAKNIAEIIKFANTQTFVFPEDEKQFIAIKENFDIAIPMIHGAGGEDGTLQKFLDELHVTYIFSAPKVHELSLNKRMTKAVADKQGLKTPKEIKSSHLTFPLFAKPNNGGSSIASRFCNSEEELDILLSENPETEFIFEEPVEGREYTVGVIDTNEGPLALPVIEIVSKTKFFDYESKYNEKYLAEEICPAKIDDGLAASLKSAALTMHKVLGVKHMSRSDFIVDSKRTIFFLEINTIPGMTKTSLVPKMAKTANLNLEKLLEDWIQNMLP